MINVYIVTTNIIFKMTFVFKDIYKIVYIIKMVYVHNVKMSFNC